MSRILKRGGSYQALVYCGTDPVTGKPIRKSKTFRRERDAKRWMTDMDKAVHDGDFTDPGRQTVGEWLEHWLATMAPRMVAPTTLQRYGVIVERHLVPALGDVRLAKLTPAHINAYYAEAAERGNRKTQGALSSTTVLQHHNVLAKALEAAVDEGRLSRNPARRVVKPTRAEREVGYFTRAQMDALATAAAGTQLYVPVLIGSWMGMRRGEILGLRWADIDFAAGRLTVCRSLEETVAEGLRYKVPKTTKGTRTIGIPAPLLAALHEERRCQVKQRTEAAGSWHENDLVCCRWDGNPIRPSTVSSNFARLVTRLREADGSREKDERLDLPTCGFHGLRHGHGTELMRSGVQQRVVQERLGHEQLSTTSVYVHLAEDFDAEAVELLSTLHLRRTEQQLNNKEPRFPSGKRGQ